ncbi:MAG: bifunctional riboflavin kinase/FAD synthetase [Clostridia bacterium]|nr:bifunctional riboflavin kinase/FAD synthetase [Clostridia bacterium]
MIIYDFHTMQQEEGFRSPLAVALGSFDGVHIGHAALIERAVGYAKEHNISSGVWTFADTPSVMPNKAGAHCITTQEDKLRRFAALGVDYVILEDFSAVRHLSPERFVREKLIEGCGAVCAICGYNFRFGQGGQGDSEALCRLMAPRGCIVVPPVYLDDEPVSSTAIRALIKAGDTETAARMLGYPFTLNAPVVHGKQLGRTIGLPTINQNFPEGCVIPKNGIYACRVETGDGIHIGVANVGVRPTIVNDTHKMNCETHILDYTGNLYDRPVRVAFYKRLRDEMKFPDVDALRRQIERDAEEARRYFADKEGKLCQNAFCP